MRTLLGHYYSQDAQDSSGHLDQKKVTLNTERAYKLYSQAVEIDPLDREAGWGYSEIAMENGGEATTFTDKLRSRRTYSSIILRNTRQFLFVIPKI